MRVPLDGRNRAQNGWFVLRTLIPSGKTQDAIVWHIRPDVIPNWTRPPVVAHSLFNTANLALLYVASNILHHE